MPRGAILWDLVEDHLYEAEFLFDFWEQSLDSPLYTLEDVARGPQQRLMAHVDALAVGGLEVARRLLLPTLDDPDEPAQAAAAALALLHAEDPRMGDEVVGRLDSMDDDVAAAVVRALELGPHPSWTQRMHAAQRSTDSRVVKARLMRALAGRRFADPQEVFAAMRTDDERLVESAALAARFAPRASVLRDLDALARSSVAAIRTTAIESGVIHGSGACFRGCLERAPMEVGEVQRRLFALAAVVADDHVCARLEAAIGEPDAAPAAIWAAGLTGRRRCIEACLARIGDESLTTYVAEALCMVTDLTSDHAEVFVPDEEGSGEEPGDDAPLPLHEDDLDADLVPGPEADLPPVDPQAALRWWAEHQDRFDAGTRYVQGRPMSPSVLGTALRESSMRHRHGLALDVAVRTKGTLIVPTRLAASVQSGVVDTVQMAHFNAQAPFGRLG